MQKNVDIFLISSAWISKFFADKMSSKKRCSIILLGSIYSKLGQNLDNYKGTNMSENYSYSIIKGGLDNATRQLASYYGRFNVRINNLCPGGLKSHVAGLSSKQNLKFIEKFKNKTPLKRLGNSKEVANVALFLVKFIKLYNRSKHLCGWWVYNYLMFVVKNLSEFNLIKNKNEKIYIEDFALYLQLKKKTNVRYFYSSLAKIQNNFKEDFFLNGLNLIIQS